MASECHLAIGIILSLALIARARLSQPRPGVKLLAYPHKAALTHPMISGCLQGNPVLIRQAMDWQYAWKGRLCLWWARPSLAF